MPGLSGSRWALKDGRSSSVPASSGRTSTSTRTQANERTVVHLGQPPSGIESAAAELSRYSMIVRRMKWKLPFLDAAYHQATGHGDRNGATDIAEAETMFKLDFFEYYMLCERALVHLQGVFGITISRDTGIETVGSHGKDVPKHRYHANVLEALDRKDNPLHDTLGVGEVRRQLARAKDLRNRWKNADDTSGSRGGGGGGGGGRRHDRRKALPLDTYDLSSILTAIHRGLDLAFAVADQFVAAEAEKCSNDASRSQGGPSLMDVDSAATEEERWGFMVEAMDWEAV